MNENDIESDAKIKDLYIGFEALFSSASLSDEEKHSLAQEILNIVYHESKGSM